MEVDIMMSCNHQFIVSMDYLFEDELRYYLVMPFIRGAELLAIHEKRVSSKKLFNEDQVRYYVA